MKNNPFLNRLFLFSTKNPNDPDFLSDLAWILVRNAPLMLAK